MENGDDEKSAPLPPPPSGGGGGGGSDRRPPDKHSSSNDDGGKQPYSSSGRRIRRRRPPRFGGATADYDDEDGDEEESKVEIESLAAASGFGRAASSENSNHHQQIAPNHTASTMNARRNMKPGAYAVDGPDHGSHDSLEHLVGGANVNPATSRSNTNSVNYTGASSEPVGLSIDGNDYDDRGNMEDNADNNNNGGADGYTIISDSAQSNQASENSAVAEVRAALEAEQEAVRAAGMGTRRPSMRSSMRSSMTSVIGGVGGSSAADGLGPGRATPSGTTSTGGVATRTSINGSRSVDLTLANHPDIEFLAEATLVEDYSASGDHARDDFDGNGRPPDYQVALNDVDEKRTVGSEDVSTIGPPTELSSLASLMRLPTRVRTTSHGSSRSRGNGSSTGIGNSSSNGDSHRGRRQRRADRPTDPYADLPEASCTSIDESTTFSRPSRTHSREMSSSIVDNCMDEQAGPGTYTNSHPMGNEEGSSTPPTEPSVLVAEPLQDKCLLPRRTVVIGLVVILALLSAVALGLAIPMSKRDDNDGPDGGASYPVYDFDLADDAVLTTVPEPICFSLLPIMSNVSKVCTDPVIDLPKGGPMCQLIADGLLGGADPSAEIDVVLVNAGGFRADILPGDLTVGYIQKMVMPFNNNLVAYLSVTPAEIYHTLNAALFDTGIVITEDQQRRNGENPTVKLTWPFESTYPYAAGLRYDVDLNAAEGQKATNVRVRSKSLSNKAVASIEENAANKTMKAMGDVEDGWIYLDPSDDATLIRVLTSDFLAGGGDGYFQTVAEERIEIDNALKFNDVFMYYCSLQSELLAPHYIDGMSTRNFVPLEGYENGQ